jgi:hypothetical protein
LHELAKVQLHEKAFGEHFGTAKWSRGEARTSALRRTSRIAYQAFSFQHHDQADDGKERRDSLY